MPHEIAPYTGADPQIFRDVDPGLTGDDDGAQPVIVIADSAGNIVATAAAAPSGSERGIITRPIAPVSGPIGVRLSDGSSALGVTSGRLHIDDGGQSLSVDDASGSLTVDAPVGTPVHTRLSDGSAALVGQKAKAASLPVTLASDEDSVTVDDGGSTISVDDNASSLTVDAPVGTPVFTRLSDGSAALIGQKAMAASLPVVLASDQGAVGVVGAAQSTVTGTITAASQNVADTTDLSTANNVSVSVYGTYAGINLSFEARITGTTTWVPIVAQRTDNGLAEITSGVLPANTTRGWDLYLGGYDRFRVRSTAHTSGTMNVVVDPGSWANEPVVAAIINKPPAHVPVDFGTVTAGVAGSTTEALISLTPVRSGAAGSAGTAHSPAAGKVFRVTGLSVNVINTAATQNAIRAYLRIVPSGTAVVTSPIHAFVGVSAPNAVSGGSQGAFIPLDIDIQPGWSFGVSVVNAINSGTNHVHLVGYEY